MVRTSLQTIPGSAFSEAATGLEAIEQLALATVELIVLDLNMPDMHGIDVLKFVRGHKAYKDVPVIVLTTRGDEASRETASTSRSRSSRCYSWYMPCSKVVRRCN
jgi:two-component system, chemotaxis family, chemotaxis protein CheY